MKQLYYEETLPPTGGSLNLYVEAGRAEVRPHDGHTVTIDAKVENAAVTVSREDATVYVRATRSYEQAEDTSKRKRLFNGRLHCEVTLVIHVPAHCEINAQTIAGRLVISGITAPVTARVTSGDAALSDLGGPIYAKIMTGRLSYEGILAPTRHRFETVTGDICLHLHKEPAAHLDAATTIGSLQCDFPLRQQHRERHIVGGRLRGVLGTGEGHIKARVTTGSFQLEQA